MLHSCCIYSSFTENRLCVYGLLTGHLVALLIEHYIFNCYGILLGEPTEILRIALGTLFCISVGIISMNLATETVLTLIRAVLLHRDLPETWDSGIDWQDVLNECRKQAIVPLFMDILPKLPLDAATAAAWKKQIYSHVLWHQRIVNVQIELDRLLRAADIPYATLKGFAAAQYYENPIQRVMGDIDILVLPDDVKRALELLRQNRFAVEEDDRNSRHIGMTKAGVHIELHRYFCITENEDSIDVAINEMLSEGLHTSMRTIAISENDSSDPLICSVFDNKLNGLILLYHIGQHLPSGLGYRQIIDFLLYSVRCLDDENWNNGFYSLAVAAQLDTLAKAVLRMGQMFFGVTDSINWCKDIGDELPKELMEYVTQQGNFGRKDGSVITHALNTTRGSIQNLLRFEQKIGLHYWKAARKYRILKPFAWIYGLVRHTRRMTERGLWKYLHQEATKSRAQSDLLDRLHVRRRYEHM